MSVDVETKEEKTIKITNNRNAGSELRAIHVVSETHIVVDVQNGSDPIATIPITLEGMEKLAEWLTKRIAEIKKGIGA